MESKLISVVTVCYNSAKTIGRTLESVKNQTYANYEYIIIDGGSTDGTLSIIEEYIPQFEGKLSYISEKDTGIYNAMNKGIRRCKGELIGIINSDDWYEPDALEHAAEAYSGEPYEVVYGMLRTYRGEQENSVLLNRHELLEVHPLMHPACFITRRAYTDLGCYDEVNYKSSSDYELFLRYFHSGKVTFTPVYKIMANYTFGGMSSSNFAVIETARLKYSLGLMSRKKYFITITKAKLSDLIGNTWESK